MSDLVTQNETPFSVFRRNEAAKLKPSAVISDFLNTQEKTQENLNLITKYWSFEALYKEIIQTPNIVKLLTEKLKEVDLESEEATKLFTELRKYKRKLQFMKFSQREKVDKKTGELIFDKKGNPELSTIASFYDPYIDSVIDMGQAIVTGEMIKLEKIARQQGGSIEGVWFVIEFTGNEKNSSNAFCSDRFFIVIA